MRDAFEIRARSPSLVLVAMLTLFALAASVLLHWFLLSMGKSLPCYLIFAVSYAGG